MRGRCWSPDPWVVRFKPLLFLCQAQLLLVLIEIRAKNASALQLRALSFCRDDGALLRIADILVFISAPVRAAKSVETLAVTVSAMPSHCAVKANPSSTAFLRLRDDRIIM